MCVVVIILIFIYFRRAVRVLYRPVTYYAYVITYNRREVPCPGEEGVEVYLMMAINKQLSLHM